MRPGDLVKLTKRARYHASRSVFEGGTGHLGVVIRPEWNLLLGEGKLRYQVLWPSGRVTSEGMTSVQFMGGDVEADAVRG
jgi:hypothetical protein